MGKDLDDLIKSLPPEKRAQYEQARDALADRTKGVEQTGPNVRPADTPNQNAIQRDAPAEPKGFNHDAKSMSDAYDQKSPTSQGKGNEIDQMISNRQKSETRETGKELSEQHQVSHQKENDLER